MSIWQYRLEQTPIISAKDKIWMDYDIVVEYDTETETVRGRIE